MKTKLTAVQKIEIDALIDAAVGDRSDNGCASLRRLADQVAQTHGWAGYDRVLAAKDAIEEES